MTNNMAPLPHEWMLVSIIGFFISIFQVYAWDKTWGITLIVLFLIIFIASLVSMSGSGVSEEEMTELAVHHPKVRAGHHRKAK